MINSLQNGWTGGGHAASRVQRSRKGWTPARRAHQAALIARWQPWRRSTGPRTDAGKARSSANALRHGFRLVRRSSKSEGGSRAYLEKIKEVRDILRASARTIVIARDWLRSRALVINGAAPACPLPRPAECLLFASPDVDIGRATVV